MKLPGGRMNKMVILGHGCKEKTFGNHTRNILCIIITCYHCSNDLISEDRPRTIGDIHVLGDFSPLFCPKKPTKMV